MANYTTNLHLEKPEYNETADIEIINQNMEKIDSEMTYKTATGTGTEIKLSLPETFGNGYNTTFIASADNGAAATTVNGKPLYKPNTTTPPNITSGKAYSIWYNAPGDCFFLKASAEGDADVSHVLATKKFSNDNDTGLVGTMPNNGAINATLNAGQSKLIPKGYTEGGTITTNSLASQTQATAHAGHMLSGVTAYVNGNKITGSIPYMNGTWADQWETREISRGQYSYNNGGMYAYMKVPANHYINGVNWIASYQPDLWEGNIVSGKNIFGVWGNATIESLGGRRFAAITGTVQRIPSTNYCYIEVSGFGFTPKYAQWYLIYSNYYNGGYISNNDIAYMSTMLSETRGNHYVFRNASSGEPHNRLIIENNRLRLPCPSGLENRQVTVYIFG